MSDNLKIKILKELARHHSDGVHISVGDIATAIGESLDDVSAVVHELLVAREVRSTIAEPKMRYVALKTSALIKYRRLIGS